MMGKKMIASDTRELVRLQGNFGIRHLRPKVSTHTYVFQHSMDIYH